MKGEDLKGWKLQVLCDWAAFARKYLLGQTRIVKALSKFFTKIGDQDSYFPFPTDMEFDLALFRNKDGELLPFDEWARMQLSTDGYFMTIRGMGPKSWGRLKVAFKAHLGVSDDPDWASVIIARQLVYSKRSRLYRKFRRENEE